jgi:metal-responsive CopG/Arc/MetJ family transcriptional regulator
VRKTKCITIDVSLLTEAEEAAARLNVPLSALVEEALRTYLRTQEGLKAVAERLAAVENMLRQCLQKAVETRREPAEPRGTSRQEPPQLGGNAWVEILRRRG